MLVHLFYNVLLLLVYPFMLVYCLVQSHSSVKYSGTVMERFGYYGAKKRKRKSSRVIWLHAVSVGEAVGATPFIRALLERETDAGIVVTTTTKGGMKVLEDTFGGAVATAYFPFDFPWVVRRAMNAFRPVALILMETEIWPDLVAACRRRGVPVLLLNGRVSDRMYASGAVMRRLYRRVFGMMSAIGMQTERDAERAKSLGAAGAVVRVVGNMKFDGVPTELDSGKVQDLRGLLRPELGPIMVAGSTHPGEEEIILDVFCRLRAVEGRLRLLLAPRHIERAADVLDITRKIFPESVLRSDLKAVGAAGNTVVVLDTIGELRYTYNLATICFVGGSLVERGGHNILEPAACGKAAFYGPHMMNFTASVEALESGGGGVMVRDAGEFAARAGEYLSDSALRQKLDDAAFKVITDNAGATERAYSIFRDIVK